MRLVWEFSGDRWQHVLFVGEADAWSPLLTSVEGTVGDELTPSPVFQELLLDQKQADLHEVQLLGRSGKILFAAAVTLDARNHSVEFDISARLRSEISPDSISSTYVLSKWQRQDSRHALIEAENGGQFLLETSEPGNGPVCQIVTNQEGNLQICPPNPHLTDSDQTGMTFRWQYRLIAGSLA